MKFNSIGTVTLIHGYYQTKKTKTKKEVKSFGFLLMVYKSKGHISYPFF